MGTQRSTWDCGHHQHADSHSEVPTAGFLEDSRPNFWKGGLEMQM